jgi:hypothetical protein
MPILFVVFLMIVLIGVGKRSREFGLKQCLVIMLVTLLQVGVFVVYMYTMQRPPLN